MNSDESMLSARVPDELKELVDADRRPNQEVVRAALWREFGGERKAEIERRIEEKERRIANISEEIANREDEIDTNKRELQALRSKLGDVQDDSSARREACLELLRAMKRANKYVFRDHEDVAELAEHHFDGDRDAALDRLRELNTEEDFGFGEVRFGQ